MIDPEVQDAWRFRRSRESQEFLGASFARFGFDVFDDGQTLPLCLFPATSLAYARARRSAAKRDPWSGLDKEWQQELEHEYHLQRVFGAARSFAELRRRHGEAFEALAVELLDPLLDHLDSQEHGEP